MSEEEKAILEEKFLRRELSEQEAIRFAEALREDEELLQRSRFSVGLAAAQQREKYGRLERQYQRDRRVRIFLRWGLPAILVLSILVVGYHFWKSPDRPFEPQEGIELLDRAVDRQIERASIGVRAGGADWQAELMAATREPERYQTALEMIQQSRNAIGPCEDYRLDYFMGLILLYFDDNDDFSEIGVLLECASSENIKDNVELSPDIEVARTLLYLTIGEKDLAEELVNSSKMNLEQLPESAQRQLE